MQPLEVNVWPAGTIACG